MAAIAWALVSAELVSTALELVLTLVVAVEVVAAMELASCDDARALCGGGSC